MHFQVLFLRVDADLCSYPQIVKIALVLHWAIVNILHTYCFRNGLERSELPSATNLAPAIGRECKP